MSGEERKILSIRTKEPYVPPEPECEAAPPAPDEPCQATIEVLKILLKEAEENRLRGFALVTWNEEANWFRNFIVPSRDNTPEGILKLASGVLELHQFVMDQAAMVAGQFDFEVGETSEFDDFDDDPDKIS